MHLLLKLSWPWYKIYLSVRSLFGRFLAALTNVVACHSEGWGVSGTQCLRNNLLRHYEYGNIPVVPDTSLSQRVSSYKSFSILLLQRLIQVLPRIFLQLRASTIIRWVGRLTSFCRPIQIGSLITIGWATPLFSQPPPFSMFEYLERCPTCFAVGCFFIMDQWKCPACVGLSW